MRPYLKGPLGLHSFLGEGGLCFVWMLVCEFSFYSLSFSLSLLSSFSLFLCVCMCVCMKKGNVSV